MDTLSYILLSAGWNYLYIAKFQGTIVGIIWTNADPGHWRIYMALGGDELKDASQFNREGIVAARLQPCLSSTRK